jgi:hypothetical protein
MPEPAQPSALAQNRADLVKRLFAVVVSVGFANELIRMEWIKQSRGPGPTELSHILFLLVGLYLIIQSWEGYFSALGGRPLETRCRFYVDTIIVFSYLVLLTVSNRVTAFLLVICVIFGLYVFWDFLTFREYHGDYGAPDNKVGTYRRQIAAAIRNESSAVRHKLSTIVAFLWFLEIYGIYLQRKNLSPYLYFAAVVAGLYVYRWDQSARGHSLAILAPVLIGGAIFAYVAIWR